MRKLLAGFVVAGTLLLGAPAQAHFWETLPRTVSHREAHKVVKMIHEHFVMPYRRHQALRIVSCESKFNKRAVNGQYLGLFQFGESERHSWGWGYSIHRQTKAAKDYFVATGRTWEPWSCSP